MRSFLENYCYKISIYLGFRYFHWCAFAQHITLAMLHSYFNVPVVPQIFYWINHKYYNSTIKYFGEWVSLWMVHQNKNEKIIQKLFHPIVLYWHLPSWLKFWVVQFQNSLHYTALRSPNKLVFFIRSIKSFEIKIVNLVSNVLNFVYFHRISLSRSSKIWKKILPTIFVLSVMMSFSKKWYS